MALIRATLQLQSRTGFDLDAGKAAPLQSGGLAGNMGAPLHGYRSWLAFRQIGRCGRLGIHELLVNSRAIKALIQTHARVEDIQKAALAEGMLTLKQDGIEKALQGKTDLAQVRAVAM